MIDRRTTLQWIITAAASLPMLRQESVAKAIAPPGVAASGYGTDPDLTKSYKPGDLWPLTLNRVQRATATALSDLIIPADKRSPAASAVGVVDFIDEWVSAPYPRQRADRETVLKGLEWIEAESVQRFDAAFVRLSGQQQRAICDDICYLPETEPQYVDAARFFACYRDLTAGGFYTTPAGRLDMQFVGNKPLASFEGPPLEVLRKAGLA